MVFFLCESCGSTLKKIQVEKHRFQCRTFVSVSCIDCLTSFAGEAYKQHVKCISEEEKYSGKNHVPKENKGDRKQQAWHQQVQQAIASVKPSNQRLRQLLLQIADYPNIPRKQSKFENFVRNSLRCHQPQLLCDAWQAIASSVAEIEVNSALDTPVPVKVDAGAQEDVSAVASSATQKAPKFKWGLMTKRQLLLRPAKTAKLKKLRKLVIAEFLNQAGQSAELYDMQQLIVKFDSKLAKNSKFKVDNGFVSLVS